MSLNENIFTTIKIKIYLYQRIKSEIRCRQNFALIVVNEQVFK